jgi:menaquinone-dependent protoporphyrinogen oxidase
MNVLIAFGSTEGQTRKIARHIETKLTAEGHAVTVMDCGETSKTPALSRFGAVIVAGSVHNKRHQDSVNSFAFVERAHLEAMPGAFISVSLSIIAKDGEAEARQYVDDFIAETGWTPKATHLAAGAVRYLEYDFFKEFTVKQLVLEGEAVPDKGTGNPEYTDWAALDAFVGSFLSDAAP